MACTSAPGIASAARTWVWAAGRIARIARIAPPILAPLLLAGNSAPPEPSPAIRTSGEPSLTVNFTGLRSRKGLLRGCLTRNPAFFPNCDKDPQSLKASVAAGPDARLHFTGLVSGDYALSILHDENANARLDTLLGIPKEGVGFSENPRLRFSAPAFKSARFHFGSSDMTKQVQIKYFL